MVTYSLVDNSIPFTVNLNTGDLCTSRSLDREARSQYKMTIVARDGLFETTAHVTILVQDENDNAPKFQRSEYRVSISEGTRVGTSIVDIVADDPDDTNNGDITYWLKNSHGAFEIDHKTGLVRLVNRLHLMTSQNSTISMEVFAQDHGVASKLSKTKLIVEVTDAVGRPPVFTQFAYTVNVDENVVDVPLITVKATDPSESSSPITYAITRSSVRHPIVIDRQTGQITLRGPFDYEKIKYVELLVAASSSVRGRHRGGSMAIVQIVVNDVNDNPPEFVRSPRLVRVPATTSVRETVYTVKALDKDSSKDGNNRVKYVMEPPSEMFTVDRYSGRITPNTTLAPAVLPLRILATDSSIYPLIR